MSLLVSGGSMLDQNTTTIITTAITAVSTLSAAILGVFLANRHNEKQEKTKAIEEREYRKKKVVEEVYEVLVRIDSLCDAFAYDVINGSSHPGEGIDVVGQIKVIRETSDRLKTLINLYIPTLKESLNIYINELGDYWNVIGRAFSPGIGNAASKGQRADTIKAQETSYKESLHSLQKKLEEMVN